MTYNNKIILIFFAISLVIYIIRKLNRIPLLNKNYRRLTKNELKEIESAIMSLDGRQFELFMGFIFRKLGYRAKVTQYYYDGGIDIFLDGKIAVQCKRYASHNKVYNDALQKLVGATLGKGINEAIVVTTSDYTPNCLKYAEKINRRGVLNLKLWNIEDIMQNVWKIDSTEIIEYINYLQGNGVLKLVK